MDSRDYRVDLLRAFACIAVLFCHSPQVYNGQDGSFVIAINNFYTMAWGAMLFFVISGICLLNSPKEAIPFLKKRLSRIIWPTIIWSLIYIFMQCYVWEEVSERDFINLLVGICIKPQYGSLWFMYALISIYLITPILTRWIHNCSQKEIRLYLMVYGIGLCLPYLTLLGINSESLFDLNGALYYFSGYLWCGVAGYYCKKYVRINLKSIKGILYAVMVLLSPLYIYIIKYYTGQIIDGSATLLSMLTTLFAVVFIYSVDISKIQNNKTLSLIINNISKYSFGIYLSHMLFLHPIRHWIADFDMNYLIQIPITAILIGVVSYCFVWCISKLPIGKYIIG